MPNPPPNADDDLPWTEERWEAFMKEGDLRSARFGELLETLIDDPDRHAKIAHEMGWGGDGDDDRDGDDDHGGGDDEGPGDAAEPTDGGPADPLTAGGGAAAGDGDFEDDEDDVDTIPAYALAFESGLKALEVLQPFGQKFATPDGQDEHDDPDADDVARLIGAASIGCNVAAAKISGGHAMGYEDDVLCGNIVNCRRGLAGVEDGLAALAELKSRGVLPPALADELTADALAVKRAVEGRIAELRTKVWWA